MSYIIEANIAIVFVYGLYLLLLRNETDFGKQRAFLVGALICALVFPLIDITPSFRTPITAIGMPTIMLPEFTMSPQPVIGIPAKDVALVIYFSVVLLISAPLLFHAGRLYQTMKQAAGQYRDNFYIIESDENSPSWSFFNTIYIGRSNALSNDEKNLVIKHEMFHGQLRHSLDILLVTITCVVFWFNPIVWFYRRTLAKVHEFEVDEMIAKQTGSLDYCELLAKTALSGNGFFFTHHFSQSFILKRINMINSIKNKISNWKLVVLGSAIALFLFAIACTDLVSENPIEVKTSAKAPENIVKEFERLKSSNPNSTFELKQLDGNVSVGGANTDPSVRYYVFAQEGKSWVITESRRGGEVFTIVEESAQPHFGMEAYYENLGRVLKYPDEATQNGIEGKVFVEFVINKDGKVSDLKVLKGIGAGCDDEAMRAILQLGDWKPGKVHGETVAQRMVLPITFKLN